MKQQEKALKERGYDVIVCGAGPEGVAAALAAAERSGSTLLVDEGADVGGSAVCGLLNRWRGDGDSTYAECLRKLTKRAWGNLIFEPEELGQVFRRLLAAAGVELLLGARAIKAKARRGRVRSVSFAAGKGRVKLSAWCYVDATQDYTLARLAGCPFEEEPDAAAISLPARVGGIDTRVPGVFDPAILAQYADPFEAEQAVEEIPAWLAFPALIPCLRGGTAILHAAGGGIPVQSGPLGRTVAESRCREGTLAAIGFLQRNVPGYENCYLIHFATQPLFTQRPQPVRRRPEASDDAAFGATEDIAVMSSRSQDNPAVLRPVPLGNLMCADMENLLLARAGGVAAEQVPLLLAGGEAAGRVAAEAVLYDGDILKLDAERLQKALVR